MERWGIREKRGRGVCEVDNSLSSVVPVRLIQKVGDRFVGFKQECAESKGLFEELKLSSTRSGERPMVSH